MLTMEQISTGVRRAVQNFPVKRVLLFGSYANGNFNEESDVDFLVEFMDESVSLILLSELKQILEDELETEVDLIHAPLLDSDFIAIERLVDVYDIKG